MNWFVNIYYLKGGIVLDYDVLDNTRPGMLIDLLSEMISNYLKSSDEHTNKKG